MKTYILLMNSKTLRPGQSGTASIFAYENALAAFLQP